MKIILNFEFLILNFKLSLPLMFFEFIEFIEFVGFIELIEFVVFVELAWRFLLLVVSLLLRFMLKKGKFRFRLLIGSSSKF